MSLLPVVAEVENVSAAEAGDVYQQGSLASLILRTFTKNKLAIIGIVIVVGDGAVLLCRAALLPHRPGRHQHNRTATWPRPAATCWGPTTTATTSSAASWPAAKSRSRSGYRWRLSPPFLGVVWGAISGYFGKAVDAVMMRVVDIFLAIPVVFLFIFISTILPTNTTPPSTSSC